MITKIKNKLYGINTSNATMIQNMMMLATGSGVGKLIGIISIPIVTRLYTPSDLGILSIFIAISSILVPLTTLRYSVAIPLPKSDAMAMNLSILSLILLCIVSIFIFIFLYLFSSEIFSKLSYEALIEYWWLLPISILFVGIYEILNQWAIRKKAFKTIAKTKAIQSISGESIKILLGVLAVKPLGLIIGYIISQAGGIWSLLINYLEDLKLNITKIQKQKILFLLSYYKDFPKFRLPSQFLLILSMQLPLLFSAWLFGIETTGQLGLAFMALALPITLLGGSMGQAYYSEIAKIGKQNSDLIYDITISTIKKLFVISVLPTLFLFFFGAEIFSLVFGTIWKEAGEFSSILSIYLLFQFLSSPLVNIFNVYNQQINYLKINILRIFLVVSVFIISFLIQLDATTTLILYSLGMVLCYIYTIRLIFNILKGKK